MAISNQGLYGGTSWFDQNQPPTNTLGGETAQPISATGQVGNTSSPTGGNTLAQMQPGQTLGSLGSPSVAGTSPSSGGAMPSVTNPNDPQQVQAFFAWLGTQPNTDPILKTPQGQQYYTQQALSTGGLTDTNYWTNKGTLAAYGGAVGAQGGGGNGQYQGGPFSMPSLQEAQNSPGYQFQAKAMEDAVQRSAAAKGTLLTGGTLKALAGYEGGLADSTYGNVFNRALTTNQTNFGNLLGLSNLGAGAVTGAAS